MTWNSTYLIHYHRPEKHAQSCIYLWTVSIVLAKIILSTYSKGPVKLTEGRNRGVLLLKSENFVSGRLWLLTRTLCRAPHAPQLAPCAGELSGAVAGWAALCREGGARSRQQKTEGRSHRKQGPSLCQSWPSPSAWPQAECFCFVHDWQPLFGFCLKALKASRFSLPCALRLDSLKNCI